MTNLAKTWLSKFILLTLTSEGLRTLVISQRLIEAKEYEAWAQRYEAARAEMDNREEAVRACIESLEQDMELLCVTGVEGIVEMSSNL